MNIVAETGDKLEVDVNVIFKVGIIVVFFYRSYCLVPIVHQFIYFWRSTKKGNKHGRSYLFVICCFWYSCDFHRNVDIFLLIWMIESFRCYHWFDVYMQRERKKEYFLWTVHCIEWFVFRWTHKSAKLWNWWNKQTK